jgi:predicted metal-dependent hydrolase
VGKTDYLKGYGPETVQQVNDLLEAGKLGAVLKSRHPEVHQIRSDSALYKYTLELKNRYLRKAGPLSKVIFDDKISLSHHALGLHTFVSRKQGRKTKAKNEIRISSVLKMVPEGMLRSVVVHELAHLREKDHNKAFYNLCCHMEPDYHQYEFDLRLYLTLKESGGFMP